MTHKEMRLVRDALISARVLLESEAKQAEKLGMPSVVDIYREATDGLAKSLDIVSVDRIQ
jgi:hypothetical protein